MTILGLWHGSFAYYDYSQIEARERQHLSTQARVIDDLVALQLEAIGNTLSRVRQDLGPDWHSDRGSIPATGRRLENLVEAMTSLRTIAILDDSGLVVASNQRDIVGKSFLQRDFFPDGEKKSAP